MGSESSLTGARPTSLSRTRMQGTIITESVPTHRLSWCEIPRSATMRSDLLQTKVPSSVSASQPSPRMVQPGKPRTAPKYRATETIMLAAIPLTGQQPARLLFSSPCGHDRGTGSQRVAVMTKTVLLLRRAMIVVPLFQAVAQAAPPTAPTPQIRTYVSGVGNDSNSCSVSSPCKTFQAALALTVAGGEIYVLNSANYGAVIINKAVTITSEGAVAGVLATSGVGITISAGATDVVNLRGLDIDGGNSGSIGIQFSSGQALIIQKSVIRGFATSGINFAPSGTGTIFVSDTAISNNGTGIAVGSNGSAVSGALTRITASGNGVGILTSGANANVTITDTVAGNNNYGIGASSSAVMVQNSTVSNNAVGIAADQAAIVRVGQSTITANNTGWQSTNNGQVQSYGTNNVTGNSSDGAITSTVALQ